MTNYGQTLYDLAVSEIRREHAHVRARTCPDCDGEGTVTREVNRRSPRGEWDEDVEVIVVCRECDGGGTI